MTISLYREMDTKERISQVWNWIDICSESGGWLVGVEIKSLKRKDPIFLRESKVEGNLVRVKSSGVNDMAGTTTSRRRNDRSILSSQIRSACLNRDPLSHGVLSHFLDDTLRIG